MTDQKFLSSLPPLREVIAEHGLNAKKSLGQNFLFDMNLLNRIVRTAGPLEGHTVYEVGPGPGGLTRAILANGAERLVAVEMDQRAWPIHEDLNVRSGGRLDLIRGDAMKVNEAEVLGSGPIRIIANLPYNVGTALLIRWLTLPTWPPFWSSLTLMFQKEVAERIVAKPNTSDYGRLAVLAQWRARPRIAFEVPRQAFTPPPKVTSAVVHLEPCEPVADVPLKSLELVTAAAFGQRRKMLRASLKSLGVDPTALLEAADIPGDLRAEVLDVPAFCRLAAAHAELAGKRKSI